MVVVMLVDNCAQICGQFKPPNLLFFRILWKNLSKINNTFPFCDAKTQKAKMRSRLTAASVLNVISFNAGRPYNEIV